MTGSAPAHDYTLDRFTIRPATRQVLVDGEPARLGARAFDVLLALVERRERVVGKVELLDAVWPGLVVEENNLQVHVSALRRLFGPAAISTIPGRGYRFTAALSEPAQALAKEQPVTGGPVAAPAETGHVRDLPEADLFGRTDDLAALCSLVESHRLVTVVGAGGIGKTRLALAAVQQLSPRWAKEVCVVELAAVSEAALVAPAIARALGLALAGREAASSELAAAIGARHGLLVLDNCEHVLEAAGATVMELLEHCPRLTVLATSQEPLHLTLEQQFRVQPLAVPPDAQACAAQEFGALSLFVARVRALDPRFELSAQTLPAAIEVCRRLDGLPLAIELAAARVPLLGVEGVRARLDDRLRVLTAGSRFTLRRHQTLRAAIEWSVSLLDAQQQAVMRRLGVFAGSFGLDSAQFVAQGDGVDEWDVLDHLGALVDKSFVTVAQSGEVPRYRMLETGRSFALEMLHGAGETELAMARHAQAMVQLYDRSLQERHLASEVRLDRYLPDLENLRAAMEWAAGPAGDPDALVALAGASAWIWLQCGQRAEGLRRCQGAMKSLGASTPKPLEARLLAVWPSVVHPRAGVAESAATSRAVALYRELGDADGLLLSLANHARVLALQHDLEGARAALDEAGRLEPPGLPGPLKWPLLVARCIYACTVGRHDESHRLATTFLEVAMSVPDARMVQQALNFLEQSACALGRYDEAVAHGRDLLDRIERDRFSASDANACVNLCMALTEQGELDDALAMGTRALAAIVQMNRGLLQPALDAFALLALRRGRLEAAARALGCVDAFYAGLANLRQFNEQRARDQTLEGLRAALPAEALDVLMEEGAAMDPEAAARLALAAG